MLSSTLLFFISMVFAVYAGFLLRIEFGKGRLASPLCLYAALCLVHFAIPGLVSALDSSFLIVDQNETYLIRAQVLAILALVSFHVTHRYMDGRSSVTREVETPSAHWANDRMLWICIFLFAIGWIDRIYVVLNEGYLQLQRAVQGQLEGPFYAAIRMIEMFPQTAVFMILIQLFSFSRDEVNFSRWQIVALVMWLTELLYWLPTGRKEEVILLLIMPFLIYNVVTRRLPRARNLFLVGGFVVLLFPISYFYRAAWSEQSLAGTDVIEVIRESASEVRAMNYDSQLSSGQIIFNRLSLLEPTAACIRLIEEGRWDPFWGSSYAQILWGVVPRAIWSDKPDFHYGTVFGQDAGYISEYDNVTSISVTYLGESYLNFGIFGFLVFGGLAFFYRGIYGMTWSRRSRLTWVFVYVTTLPILLYAGGTFALYFGGLVKLLPMHYLLGRMAEPGKGPRGNETSLGREQSHENSGRAGQVLGP